MTPPLLLTPTAVIELPIEPTAAWLNPLSATVRLLNIAKIVMEYSLASIMAGTMKKMLTLKLSRYPINKIALARDAVAVKRPVSIVSRMMRVNRTSVVL